MWNVDDTLLVLGWLIAGTSISSKMLIMVSKWNRLQAGTWMKEQAVHLVDESQQLSSGFEITPAKNCWWKIRACMVYVIDNELTEDIKCFLWHRIMDYIIAKAEQVLPSGCLGDVLWDLWIQSRWWQNKGHRLLASELVYFGIAVSLLQETYFLTLDANYRTGRMIEG